MNCLFIFQLDQFHTVNIIFHSRFQGFKVLFAMITYNVSDLIKKIQKIVKKPRKPIKKL